MTSKPQLIMLILAYLFVVSSLFAFTYETTAWTPDSDAEVLVYDVNFSDEVNLSELNIDVISGRWEIENGNLTAKSANNMFIIPGEYDFWDRDHGSVVTYKLYDINSMTRLMCYYDEGLVWDRESYVELDIFEGVVNIVYTADSGVDILDVYDVHWSGAYEFDLTDSYEIEIGIVQMGLNDPLVNVTINDELVCAVLVPAARGFSVERHQSGVYAQNSGLKVNFVSEFEVVKEEDSEGLLSSLGLILTILLFIPPEVIMPFWLNFLAFKIPLAGVGVIGYEMVRGI